MLSPERSLEHLSTELNIANHQDESEGDADYLMMDEEEQIRREMEQREKRMQEIRRKHEESLK